LYTLIVNVILTSESLSNKQLGQYAEDHSGRLFFRALPIELNPAYLSSRHAYIILMR